MEFKKVVTLGIELTLPEVTILLREIDKDLEDRIHLPEERAFLQAFRDGLWDVKNGGR